MVSQRISSPDVDGGWAIVIVLCGVLVEIITFGLSFSGSIFYSLFLEEFQESPVDTAWAINVNYFCSLAGGIFGNCVLVLLGPRLTIVIGCLLTTTGIIACSFVTSLWGILIMYGIVTGVGNSFVFLAIFSVIPVYFKKYRVIAAAIASTGVGLGQFINPPIIRYLESEFHWKGAFLILGAISLNNLIPAAAIIPPRQFDGDLNKSRPTAEDDVTMNVFRKLYSGISVFRLPLWYLYLIGRISISVGMGGFQTHIFNFGRLSNIGLSPSQQTFLPSLVGIGSISGRLIIGLISQVPKTHKVLCYMLVNSLAVIGNLVISFTKTYAVLAACAFITGASLGGNAILYEVIIHITGLKLYSSALSYSMLLSGFGLLLGGPLAAWIYEIDPSYMWTFRAASIIILFGIIINLPSWLTFKDGRLRQRLPKDEQLRREADACKNEGPSGFRL